MLVEAMERLLTVEPLTPTRNRKPLRPLRAPWSTMPPVWELRVDQYRIFYDAVPEDRRVFVRAIRRKPPHRTTEDIL
jgi:mRNA-degrading endonuclease RelE of RelBE toxin-antitoxin system